MRTGAGSTFTVAGTLDPVVRTAAQHALADLEVSRPSLEDAFAALLRARRSAGGGMSIALDRRAARSERLSLRAPWLHIARYALRRRRTAPLAWGLPLAALAVTVVAIFPSISASPQLDQLIESYPEALKEAFGFSAQSFSSPEGYLAGELFSLIAPFACCYFVLHGLAVALRGADQRATLDVVLSTPIRRRQYIAGWFAALALALLGILAVLGS